VALATYRTVCRRPCATACAAAGKFSASPPWLSDLGAGHGANTTTIFSVINATLLRQPPFPEANRLVLARETVGGPRQLEHHLRPNFWRFTTAKSPVLLTGWPSLTLAAGGTTFLRQERSMMRSSFRSAGLADFFFRAWGEAAPGPYFPR